MVPNKLALVAVAAMCVTAAGAGGYIATRQAAVVTPASAMSARAEAQPSNVSAVPPSVQPPPAAGESSQPVAPRLESATVAPAQSPIEKPTAPPVASAAPARHSAPETSIQASGTPRATAQGAAPDNAPPSAAVDERTAESRPAEPQPPAEAQRHYAELVVRADSVIGFQSETALNSERARVEDRVEARVARDVLVDGYIAVPAGTRAIGSVTVVDRGGRFRERARLGIRFHTLVLADGTRLSISTDPIYRYGEPPSDKSAAKIGAGAAAGAILGAIIGGGKGAAIGATAGAGAGTATVMAADRGAATFPVGLEVTARVAAPLSVTVERD